MKKKFNNDDERKAARRVQMREAQTRYRAKSRLPQTEVTQVDNVVKVEDDNNYNALLKICTAYPFSHFITIKTVNFSIDNDALRDSLNWLFTKDYISNYIVTNVNNALNSCSYILFQVEKWGFNLEKHLNNKWGEGNYKLKHINQDNQRINAIRSCLGQLDLSLNHGFLELPENKVLICLTQTFDGLKRANIDRVEEYKKRNGLTCRVNN
jgi:hypothetical protein